MTDRHRMADYDIAFIAAQIVYVDLWSNETAIIATRFYCPGNDLGNWPSSEACVRFQTAQTAHYPAFAHPSSSGDLKESPDVASNK
jgi:hypothetical protein